MSNNNRNRYARHQGRFGKNTRILIGISLLLVLVICFGVYQLKDCSWQDIYASFGLKSAVSADQIALADGETSVGFLSVGQGDCSVIRDGETVTVIDAGIDTSEAAIKAYLDSCGITRIDYLIATHPHTDHIGSMAALIEQYEIGVLYFTHHSRDLTPTNDIYLTLLKTIQRHGVKTVTVDVEEEIQLPHGTIKFLSAGGYGDLNNCSIVLRYDYDEISFLFSGDAETVVERALMEKNADLAATVLKAGHHGSKNATGTEFLQAVRPRYVVFSCGIDNEYGYPKEQVLERVAKIGATAFRTDLAGHLVFITDGRTLRPITGEALP